MERLNLADKAVSVLRRIPGSMRTVVEARFIDPDGKQVAKVRAGTKESLREGLGLVRANLAESAPPGGHVEFFADEMLRLPDILGGFSVRVSSREVSRTPDGVKEALDVLSE